MTSSVTREQVLAYRVAAQDLTRDSDDPSELGVLDLGIQDTPTGSAGLALAARLASPRDPGPTGDGSLELAWSVRGAPHLHRPADLPGLAAALWPRSEADAVARLAGAGEQIGAAGTSALSAFAEGVEAWRAAVTGPTAKGEASAGVTAGVPDALSAWCESCGARHVHEQLFRLTALPAGMRIVSPRTPVTFAPIADWPGVPPDPGGRSAPVTDRAGAPDPAAPARLITTYLRLLGPASHKDVADFLGTRPGAIEPVWPEGLAEVGVDGRRAWLPEAALPALHGATTPGLVRLLPPSDPFLQARDRELVLPDRSHRGALWRGATGRTGAVLVGAEITGVWRARARGRNRLTVSLTAFTRWPAATRAAVEEEAGRVAAARGMAAVEVHDEN